MERKEYNNYIIELYRSNSNNDKSLSDEQILAYHNRKLRSSVTYSIRDVINYSEFLIAKKSDNHTNELISGSPGEKVNMDFLRDKVFGKYKNVEKEEINKLPSKISLKGLF